MGVLSVAPPDAVFFADAGDRRPVPAAMSASGHGAEMGGVGVTWDPVGDSSAAAGLAVQVHTDGSPVSRIALRWKDMPARGLILGDAWERGYGDLQWRPVQPDRPLPWYWLAHDPGTGRTTGLGVRVRPHAFCAFTVDGRGVTLWLDLRNGSLPLLGPARVIPAATVVAVAGNGGAFAVAQELCAAMSTDPVPDAGPLVGVNDWYYAYGSGTSSRTTLRDARTIAELAGDAAVRPFAVVDGGWSEGGGCPGGPYTHGVPGRFDDMADLAASLLDAGTRPGVWIRPTSTISAAGRTLRPGAYPEGQAPLDLSVAENIDSVARDVSTVVGWGYQLLKHDFSTFDVFGRFGHAMQWEMTDPGWHHADTSLTNAEIISRLYETIAGAAGDAVIVGCNTVGHLAAGLVHANRTGDDTSGRFWETTRRKGVNSLAFRLPQHGTFFAADADCVPCTPVTPWELNRQFLDVVARSGTPLFLSIDPEARTAQTDADMTAAVGLALAGGESGGLQPVDWLETTAPRRWRAGSGVNGGTGGDRTYDWDEPAGPWPLES